MGSVLRKQLEGWNTEGKQYQLHKGFIAYAASNDCEEREIKFLDPREREKASSFRRQP